MIKALEQAEQEELQEKSTPFGQYEEEAIVALILDHPEFFVNIVKHLHYSLFKRPEVQYVIACILEYHEKYEDFPTRPMLRDVVAKKLTVDEPYYEEVLDIVKRPSNPRDIPALKDNLTQWARRQVYAKLWEDPETLERYKAGDYQYIDKIIDDANQVAATKREALWLFDELDKLFIQEEKEKFTTGIFQLDKCLDGGRGPGRKEVVLWMAPTGVGKSIKLINDAVANSKIGKNVLFITLELSVLRTAIRALGAMSNKPITSDVLYSKEDELKAFAQQFKASGAGDIAFYEFPPDQISVSDIYSLVEDLKRSRGWVPDVIIIDYLELMVSRRESDNKDDYTRQKAVATQVRGVAQTLNVLVFSATQTNRSGNEQAADGAGPKNIDVTKVSESYGKLMPIDYLISINQTQEEYNEQFEPSHLGVGRARLFIAKNRNGVKFESIEVTINYKSMMVREVIKSS
jgi:replicative DNA helicase